MLGVSFFRCDICSALSDMRERARSEKDLELAQTLMSSHVDRYSNARLEIERLNQLGVLHPKRVLTLMLDCMDSKKVHGMVVFTS